MKHFESLHHALVAADHQRDAVHGTEIVSDLLPKFNASATLRRLGARNVARIRPQQVLDESVLKTGAVQWRLALALDRLDVRERNAAACRQPTAVR